MPDDEDQEEEDIREESTIVDVRQVVVGYYQGYFPFLTLFECLKILTHVQIS